MWYQAICSAHKYGIRLYVHTNVAYVVHINVVPRLYVLHIMWYQAICNAHKYGIRLYVVHINVVSGYM